VGDGYTKEMAYNDLYREALKEAERRKNENMRKLYSYKLL